MLNPSDVTLKRHWTTFFILVILGVSLPGGNVPQTLGGTSLPSGGSPWPRQIETLGTLIEVYQPQLERWSDNKLEAYAAVVIKTPRSKDKAYGVIWFSARTEVDKANRLVTLDDFRVTRRSFPSLVNNGSQYLPVFQINLPSIRTIPLDLLETSLFTMPVRDDQKAYQLENEEPHIIFSSTPAVLALIDGQPEYRPVGENLQVVINTSSLIVLDPARQMYYLALMDGWAQAPAQTGPWSAAENLPSKSLDRLRRASELTGRHQVLGNPEQSLMEAYEDGEAPTVYVSTVPTELLLAQGPPQFTPIVGTSLLYVENSGNDIFMDNFTQMFYVLVSGRWFTSNSLENGPWSYVSPADLPSDFAEIPSYSPKASVLVSVPRTPQANEALIANQIPQTATISRGTAKLRVRYYGTPDFRLIEGTNVRYAVNTATPVVSVLGSNIYYAVENAVWFSSSGASGPWSVATSVPQEIYTIPPSCPIHYITYVQIYGHTPTKIFMGYTPGYYGTVVSWDNVVVYGTGWNYPPYIGSANWVPRVHTYGAGSSFSWSVGTGWSLTTRDKSSNPYSDNITHRGNYGAPARNVTYNVRTGPVREITDGAGYSRNNVYADHDGNIYRVSPDSGWQQRTSRGWSTLASAGVRSSLENWQSARALGALRWSNFHTHGGRDGRSGSTLASR